MQKIKQKTRIQLSDPGQYYLYLHYKSSVLQMRASAPNLTAPLTVISSDQTPFTGDERNAWVEGQQSFAAQRSNRRFIFAAKTSHYVFLINPSLVTDQIVSEYKADCM
jgi:pimeloyl-ACP methyl ester carboxylesterase